MKSAVTAVWISALLSLTPAGPVQALTIDFDDLSPGTALASQYLSQGVVFSADAFSGPGSSSSGQPWANNTDLTVVSLVAGIDGEDYGALGDPPLASGNIVRRYLDWLGEDGDPSFRIEFATPASSVSVVFVGIGSAAVASDNRLFAYDGALLLTTAIATLPDALPGQVMLTVSAPAITSVVVAPGSYDDWVGIDLVTITPVPEPASRSMLLLAVAAGAAAAGVRRRRTAGREER